MKTLNKYINEGFLKNVGAGLNSLIDKWLKENTNCKHYTINPDGTIDVDSGIEITNKNITEFPDYVRFGKVNGDFNCSYCKLLKSLEGSPKEVGGSFICTCCKSLKSLEGAPKKVGGDFYCSGCNSLTSLEGSPKEVGGHFNCSHCNKQFTEEDVKKVSKVKRYIYI